MNKYIQIFLVLMVSALLFIGCSGISKKTKVQCPACGAIFTVDEGLRDVGR